jgi:hypothetical protein
MTHFMAALETDAFGYKNLPEIGSDQIEDLLQFASSLL